MQGFNKKIEGKKNLLKIVEWYLDNEGTQAQCSIDLGLSPVTIRKHVNNLKDLLSTKTRKK